MPKFQLGSNGFERKAELCCRLYNALLQCFADAAYIINHSSGQAASVQATRSARRSRLFQRIGRDRWMYSLVAPGLVFFLVFRYLPLLGNVIAFQDYSPFLGFWDSPWIGLNNFRRERLATHVAYHLAWHSQRHHPAADPALELHPQHGL